MCKTGSVGVVGRMLPQDSGESYPLTFERSSLSPVCAFGTAS